MGIRLFDSRSFDLPKDYPAPQNPLSRRSANAVVAPAALARNAPLFRHSESVAASPSGAMGSAVQAFLRFPPDDATCAGMRSPI